MAPGVVASSLSSLNCLNLLQLVKLITFGLVIHWQFFHFPSFFFVTAAQISLYSQLSLRWTPLGPALAVRLREMSVL